MLILYLVLFKLISARFTCDESPVKYHFYKIKSCHRSTLQSISKKNLNTLVECKKFANDKHALAFNFSPIEGRNYLKKTSKICEILECPEVGVNSSTLVLDAAYDYYSAYGNNASCKYFSLWPVWTLARISRSPEVVLEVIYCLF